MRQPSLLRRYILFFCGVLCAALGIALMVNHFVELPIGMVTLAINIPLLVLAW